MIKRNCYLIIWVIVIILWVCITITIGDNKQDNQENIQLIMPDVETSEVKRKFLSDKYTVSEVSVDNTYTPNIYAYKDQLYIDNVCYRYEQGMYCVETLDITEELSDIHKLEYNVKDTSYCRDYIVYLLERENEQKLLFLNVQSLKEENSIYIESGEISLLGTYENYVYYMYDCDENDESKLCRYNCTTTDIEILYKNSGGFTSTGIREDGTVVFYVTPFKYQMGPEILANTDAGYYKYSDAGCEKIRESFEHMRYYVWPIVMCYDNTGLYLWIEYHYGEVEIVRIRDDGQEDRIRINVYQGEFLPYEEHYVIVQRDGTIEKYAYEYATHDVTNTPEYLWEYDALPLSVDYSETLSDEMLEAGYSLSDAIKDKECIWLFFQNEDKELIVKKYEVA